ncbi:MAG: N-acetyltransferase [Betaproteobacteria bacterium]|nr:MAG: N-acetyltransferase [Betaproteobacteria bacterium]
MLIRPVHPQEIDTARRLLVDNGWTRKVEDATKFNTLVQRSQIALVAVENEQVVGFLRAITDGIFNGYISMVVVAKEFQRRGIGAALVREAMGTNTEITWVLRADREGVPGFYEKLGFRPSMAAMERRRQ